MRYSERIQHAKNPIAKELFRLMEEKESNLCVAADITSTDALVQLMEKTGDHICVLKTHIDIIEDFSMEFVEHLLELKQKYQFLIFEDRKFADIGNTVQLQYEKGIYHIAEWADIINAHTVPGPGVIEGLQKVGLPRQKALLLLAEMSSAGTLAKDEYTQATVEMAQHYPDYVIGFIGQHRLLDDPGMLVMTPGVQMESAGDNFGQQYNTPQHAIEQGADVIIVGRGIYESADPSVTAQQYKKAGWDAYTQLFAT